MEYKMIEEIHETPQVVEHLISNESEKIAEIAKTFKKLSPCVMIAAGRGTSDNACIPIIVFAPDDSTLNLSLKVIDKIKETGSHTLIVSDNDEILKRGDLAFKISKTKKELYPFEMALFIQLFAYNLSISKGLNPDIPRFLHKISKI